MMFDPTIYDNLKVGFENHLYDLDNLDELISITDRKDQLEMARMSREFVLRFSLRDHPDVTGEVVLGTSLEDLAAEILETPGGIPGCRLQLRFGMVIREPETQCPAISSLLQECWPEQRIMLRIEYVFENHPASYNVTAEVFFDRSVNEDQMGDIPELCDHMVHVLTKLLPLHT